MHSLIKDLLAYSRTTLSELKYRSTDLNKLIMEVKKDLKEELVHHSAVLKSNELFTLHIIPFQFRQKLQNLISNSLKLAFKERQLNIVIESAMGLGSEFELERLSASIKYCHIYISNIGIRFDPK